MATIVLPEPTSPSRRRDMGFGGPFSGVKFFKILSIAFFWAPVSSNGSFFIKVSSSVCGFFIENDGCWSRDFRQLWRESWIKNISSNENRFLAASAHLTPRGKCISRSAVFKEGRLYFFKMSSGMWSSKLSSGILPQTRFRAKRSQRDVSPRVSG